MFSGEPTPAHCPRTSLSPGPTSSQWRKLKQLLPPSGAEDVVSFGAPDEEREDTMSTAVSDLTNWAASPMEDFPASQHSEATHEDKELIHIISKAVEELKQGTGLFLWKDAYFHIQTAPRHRRFLRVAFEGVAYQFTVSLS